MTAHKSSYRKSNSDKAFMKFIFFGFGTVLATLILGLILFNVFSDELKYNSFEEINNFQEITTQPEEQYLVYYYGENCGACVNIKGSVLDSFDNIDIKVYLVESKNVNGVNTIKDPITFEDMKYTPTLLTIKNGIVVDMNVGGDTVVDILSEIKLDTYTKLD